MPRRMAVLIAALLLVGGAFLPGVVGASNHLSNAGPVSGPGPFSAPSGPTVTVEGSATVNLTNPFPTANTVRLWTSKGNLTATASGDADATVHFDDFEGTWTNATALDVTSNPLTLDPGDKDSITVSGDTESLNFTGSMAPDDGQADFVYAGSSGTTTVTARGLPANTEIAAVDIDSHSILAIAMTDGSGTATFSGMANSEHTVHLMTTQGGPVVNDSSATPTGGISNPSQALSIDVSDPDFPNDEVTVEFFVDGNSIGTDTLTSDGTATQNHEFQLGGEHTWHVEATDEYGTTATSSTFTVNTPSNLSIYNESAPTQLVDNATVELRFFVDESSGSPQIFERNTSDGTVNMTGLPVDQPFIVVAEADGYFSRRIFVPSLFETQQVFLLPENDTAVPVTFAIEDYTGRFPQENTVLQVQRALNGSYQTVVGDYFGATGSFPATLAYNQRHRLVILNVETGDERILGTFTPQTASGERILVSPRGDIQIEGISVTVQLPQTTRLPPLASVPFNASLLNASQDIQSWSLTLSVNGTTVFSDSGSGEATINTALNLTSYPGQQLTANMTYTLSGGQTNSSVETYTIGGQFTNDDALVPSIRRVLTLVPTQNQDSFGLFLAMMITVLGTAAVVWAFPMSSEFVAMTAWLFLAFFAVLGFINYDLLFITGVLAGALAYLRRVG